MSKTIGSYPGAVRFRSYTVIIIVLTLIGLYFSYTGQWEVRVEMAAKQKTLNEINSALALTLYQMAINRDLASLPKLDSENPFVYLAIYRPIPQNYQGTVRNIHDIKGAGWYYDLYTRFVYYVDQSGYMQRYKMVFEFEDINSSGKFEYSYDSILNLTIKRPLYERGLQN